MIESILALFGRLDADVSVFQSWSSIRCAEGCCVCCEDPQVEATILEFLPLANFLYHQGVAEDWYQKLKENQSPICLFLSDRVSGKGHCTQYAHRGLICRLFGFSARTGKLGQTELVTCYTIKTEQTDGYLKTLSDMTGGQTLQTMNQYCLQLQGIDYSLTRNYYPVNQALLIAFETIMHFYSYHDACEDFSRQFS